MKTELSYLLEELENWADNDVITVQKLKRMIEKAFRQAAQDCQDIQNSIDKIGHDM